VLWFELALGIDHLREFGAAGKGCGAKKPAEDSAATWRFIRQTAKTFVNSAERRNGF